MSCQHDFTRGRFDASDDPEILEILESQHERELRQIDQIDALLQRGLIRERPESGAWDLISWIGAFAVAGLLVWGAWAAAMATIQNTAAQAAEWQEWR